MDIKEVEKFLKENKAYIISSIDGKGFHIGRLKQISLDANNDIVIEVDIDKESVVG